MTSWKSAFGIGFIKGFGDWDLIRILGETPCGRRSPYRQKCAQDQVILTTFATQPRRRRADVAPRSRRRRVDVLLTWRPATPQRRPATRRVGRRPRRNPPRTKHFTVLLRRSCGLRRSSCALRRSSCRLRRSSGGLPWLSGGLPRLIDGLPRRSGGLPRSVGGLRPGRSAPPRLRLQGSSVWCVTSSPKGENFYSVLLQGTPLHALLK